jgi:uncharacterized protein YegL
MTTPTNPSVFAPMQHRVAHVAIVLDRSGSMESCRDETIEGFNEYAQQIRATAAKEELQVRLTLTVFNGEIRMPLFEQPLTRLHRMTRKYYVPDGSTAMLDAVGHTIDRLEREGTNIAEASVLVCIISDGHENASHDYSYADIAKRIGRLTATERWTFTYLGANQDLSHVSEQLNIPFANTTVYSATRAGTSDAWQRQSRATSRRMRGVQAGESASLDFYAEEPTPSEVSR